MTVMKIRMNRQLTIPKAIFDELGLREGDYVEVCVEDNNIVIRPKRLVPLEDTLSPEEEALVAKGFEQLKRGEYTAWEELKRELDL